MDGITLRDRIYAGMARTAERLGFPYDVFRPDGPGQPLCDENRVVMGLLVSVNNRGSYEKPHEFGEPVWWSYHDGLQTQPGDYLVGGMGIFFVASQQDISNMQLVQCNRTVTVTRPAQPMGKGAVGYGGEVPASDPVLLTRWPCSCLEGSKGEENKVDVPLDVKNPWWRMLLPALPGVELQASDVLTDEAGNRYFVNSAELTALGWRLKTVLKQA